jgi:hypothetical protein
MKELTIDVRWDDSVGVWIATSTDIPGLVSEADTIPGLKSQIQVAAPRLLSLQGLQNPGKAHLRFVNSDVDVELEPAAA